MLRLRLRRWGWGEEFGDQFWEWSRLSLLLFFGVWFFRGVTDWGFCREAVISAWSDSYLGRYLAS